MPLEPDNNEKSLPSANNMIDSGNNVLYHTDHPMESRSLPGVITSQVAKYSCHPTLWLGDEIKYNQENGIAQLPEPIHESHNVLYSKPRNNTEIPPALENTGPGLLSNEPETDPFEQAPLTTAEEEFITGHDLARLPPRIFRQLPAAILSL